MNNPAVIPYPRQVNMGEGHFDWSASESIRLEHLHGLFATEESVRLTLDFGGKVKVDTDATLPPEGYRLAIQPDLISVTASDRNGRLYAAQTLAQWAVDGRLPCAEIVDWPRFGWRGMMLDPSRHFVPKEFVLKFIDLMLMHKLNSLHLHLCDDQGWRIEIKEYPRLTEVGSRRTSTQLRPGSEEQDCKPHGGFYTQEDLRQIVAYAAERGIRVVPEIEMPGHCQAALASYPELGNTGNPLETATRFGVIEDVYGVQDETIRFLEDVLTEVLDIFPSEFIHVGGDEVPKNQWKASAVAQAKIKELGLADEDELQSWFIRHFDEWLRARGRRLVGWDEILEGGLASGATVMSWRGFSGGIAAAKAGHDVVMAPTGHCYFDHYQSQFKSLEPTAIGGFLSLEKVYEFEPVPPELTEEEGRHVLGGQGQLWSEYLRTTDHLEYMALPRLCALSEVLWGKSEKDYDDFVRRLEAHLPRLALKNFRFRPLQPDVPEGYFELGGWELDQVGKEGACLTMPTSFETDAPFNVSVHYGGGAYGVWIDRIEAAGSDATLAMEMSGSTGNADEGNYAEFPAMNGPISVKVWLRSKGAGELERNTKGTVFAVLGSTGT